MSAWENAALVDDRGTVDGCILMLCPHDPVLHILKAYRTVKADRVCYLYFVFKVEPPFPPYLCCMF